MYLAELISKIYGVDYKLHENPRKELLKNDLEVSNHGLRSLGFEPILLNEGLLDDVKIIAEQSKNR